jgi:hypothetical protein
MGWWVGGGIDFLSTQSWLERPGSEKSLQIFFFCLPFSQIAGYSVRERLCR